MNRTPARALLVAWAIALAIALVPLALGLGGKDTGGPGLDPARLAHLARNSLTMALLATLASAVPAVAVAIAAARLCGPRARRVLLGIASLPLFVPPAVVAVAAVWLFGANGALTRFITHGQPVFPVAERISAGTQNLAAAPIYTIPGAALTLAWGLFPLMALAGASAMGRTDRDAEQSALLDASPVAMLLRMALPMAAGGFVAGAGLVFLFAVTDFAVPEALRSLPVLVSEVYTQFGVFYDTRPALGASIVLVVLAGAALAVLARAVEEPAAPDAAREQPLAPTAGTRALYAAGWFAAVAPVALLVVTLGWSMNGPPGRWATWAAAWHTAHEELFFTTSLGIGAALLAALLGTAMGVALSALRSPRLARVLIIAPLVIPGPVFGVSLQVLMSQPPDALPLRLADVLAAAGNTLAPLVFVWAIRFACVIALPVERLVRRVPPDVLESARLDGAGLLARARHFLLPAAWPAIAAGTLAAFALTLGEAGAAVLLLPPGPTTLGVRILTQMHYAPVGQVSALCLMAMLPGIAAALLAFAVWRFGTTGGGARRA